MIRYYSHLNSYIDIFKNFNSIYLTPKINQSTNEWQHVIFKLIIEFNKHGYLFSFKPI
jgi:hypothetical protein